MDLYGDIQAINDAPDLVRARSLRREARRAAIYDNIGEAIGPTRAFEAAVQWSLKSHDADSSAGAPIGSQHPGVAAHHAVAAAMGEFHIPTTYQIRFAGMKRFKGRGAHRMVDGVVTMEMTLRGLSGHQDFVDVPVIVKEGRVFEPVCVIHHQNIRAMTQHTFDDILKRGEFTSKIPDRKTMYSGPPSGQQATKEVPLVRPGIYGVSPMNRSIKSNKSANQGVETHLQQLYRNGTPIADAINEAMNYAGETDPNQVLQMAKQIWSGGGTPSPGAQSPAGAYYNPSRGRTDVEKMGLKAHRRNVVASAIQGFYVEAMREADDSPDHIDWGERPLAPMAPGDEGKLAKALDVPGRDGYRWHLEKGTKVTIVRNRHAGEEFVVWADGCDHQLTIPGDAIA